MTIRYTTLFLITTLAYCSLSAQDKSYMIVFLNKKSDLPKLPPEEAKRISDGHFSNMARLAKEGKLLAAGPFEGGGGIFILNTTDQSEAEEWIGTDPGIQARRWNIEVLPYSPRYRGVCPQSPDSIQMVNYTFVRYHVVIAKFSANSYQQILDQHIKYLATIRQQTVITESSLGDREGSIVVLDGELLPDQLTSDPGVQQGLIEPEIKKLYIARGSFCEKK